MKVKTIKILGMIGLIALLGSAVNIILLKLTVTNAVIYLLGALLFLTSIAYLPIDQ